MSALNPDHQDYVRWVCDASIDKGKRTIKALLDRPAEREPKLDVAKVLGDALGYEVKGQNRRALKNAIQSALAKLEKPVGTGLTKASKKPIDGKAELVKQDDLPSLGASIGFVQKEIDEIGRKAMQTALPLKLKQGLCCLKAQAIYTTLGTAKGGRPKNRSESDQLSEEASEEPASFNDWIATQPLGKGTAYDLMQAVEGLGLDHKATEKQLAKAFEAARKKADGDLTITKLKRLANKGGEDDDEEEDPNSPEAKAREALRQADHWISTWDRNVKVGNLENADTATLKKLDEFLTNTREHIRKRIRSANA